MKIFNLKHAWLAFAIVGLLSAAIVSHAAPAAGTDKVKNEIDAVTDPLLHGALLELLQNAQQMAISDKDEIVTSTLKVYLSVQSVHAYFEGYKEQHTDKVIDQTKSVIKTVCQFAVDRLPGAQVERSNNVSLQAYCQGVLKEAKALGAKVKPAPGELKMKKDSGDSVSGSGSSGSSN